MSLALARKYRPRNFASVAVQTHVSRTLRGAIARNRVAHGYLLCGPRGTGKTTLARVLAMALNCERRNTDDEAAKQGEPCGECISCQRIWAGSASLDVVEIDAASNRGVDDARDLRERAMYAPSSDTKYKVYIIDEAHMLTREAWNALLKVLEEPPPRVVFVFATTEPQKIAQTAAPVLSRMQRFDLKRIGPAEIRARLSEILALEKVEAEPDAVGMIARAADGSMRDALSLADQVLALSNGVVTSEGVRESLGLVPEDEYFAILNLIVTHDAGGVFPAVGRLADAGVDFATFLGGISDTLRALLAMELGSEPQEISEKARQTLASYRGKLSSGDLVRMLNMIGELEQRFKKSSQQQLLIETLLVRFALLDRTIRLEELLEGMGSEQAPPKGGGGSGGSGAPLRKERAGDDPQAKPRVLLDRAEPRAAAESRDSPSVADRAAPRASPPGEQLPPLDLNHLAERWDEIVDKVRSSGRAILAGHLGNALPTAVSARGVITVQLDSGADSAFDLVQEALNAAQTDVLAAVRTAFSGVEKVALAPVLARESVAAQESVSMQKKAASPLAARRLTEEAIKAEKLASLRKKDPVLDAAVRELDLELLE